VLQLVASLSQRGIRLGVNPVPQLLSGSRIPMGARPGGMCLGLTTSPVSRYSRSNFSTTESDTPKNSATSRWEAVPLSQAATNFRRKSLESTAAIASLLRTGESNDGFF
jgi:hypothetical protein